MLKQVLLNKVFHLLVALGFIVGITICSPVNVFAQQSSIPSWVKDNVKLWSNNQLGDDGFESSIQYLINQGAMSVPLEVQNASATKIPAYVKNTAGWWADGKLLDYDFMQGIEYLLKTGIIQFKMASTQPVTNPIPSVTNLQNVTTQNMQNNPSVPTNTQPVVKPIKILLLVSNWPVIYSTNPYSFQARVFDASQIPGNQVDQNTFNQNWGTLSGVRVQGYLTSSDNKTTFYTWDGVTNQFGYFVGNTLLRNEPTNQMYFVHFNATKSGMVNDSKTLRFQLLNGQN